MAITYVANQMGLNSGYYNNASIASPLAVAAADILIGLIVWYGDVRTVSSITDGGSNSLTVLTKNATHDNEIQAAIAYKLVASANASASFTATLSGAANNPRIRIFQFRPSGGSVSLDIGPVNNNGQNSQPATSASFSTVGADEVVVGWAGFLNSGTASSMTVGGVAADGSATSTFDAMWYKILTGTISSQVASCGWNGSYDWAASAVGIYQDSGETDPITWTTHLHKTLVFG